MKTFNQFQESVATLGLKAGSKFVLPALMAGIGAAGTIMQMGRPRKDGSTNDKKNVRSDILDDLMKKQKEVENIRKNKEKYTGRVDPTRGQTFKRTTFDKPTTVKPENEFHTNVDPNKDIIKPKKGEVEKTEKLIDKYKETNKVIKPKEGEVTKQRELLKNVEKNITKPKKGEKKDASKTLKDFIKARKKEGETMYRLKQDAEIADKGPGDLLPAAKKSYLEKLRRNLRKEEVTIANSLAGGQIAGTPEAGDDPPVKKKKGKKKRYIYGGRGSRKMWMNK